jgi:hypothetical protein
MIGTIRCMSVVAIVIAVIAILVAPGHELASEPGTLELICQVESVRTTIANGNIVVPVNVSNFADSIAGAEIWIALSEPYVVKFQIAEIEPGPTPIYHARFDTAGTRVAGWEMVEARLLDGSMVALINIVALANLPEGPVHSPLGPGSGAFINLLLEPVFPSGDPCDSVIVNLLIYSSQTHFADPQGNLIGFTCTSKTDLSPDDCVFDTAKALYIDGKISFGCCEECGDADGNGLLTISDAVRGIGFLYAGAPAFDLCGDADGYDIYTIRDVIYMSRFLGAMCVALPKIVAQPTTEMSVTYENLFPAGASSATIEIRFENTGSHIVNGFDMPLKTSVGGQKPLAYSASTAGSTWPAAFSPLMPDTANATFLLSSVVNVSVGAGDYLLAQLTVNMAPSGVDRQISLEFTGTYPYMDGAFEPPNTACHYTMFLDESLNAWEPVLSGVAPSFVCGDADGTRFISISDVVYIINFIFGGGTAPYPLAAGDADCNMQVNISDAVRVINYIFVGGAAPCDCGK